MRYLKIEFSDDDGETTYSSLILCSTINFGQHGTNNNLPEASRFKQKYETLYQEEMSRPIDSLLNWQMNVGQQRPESLLSSSPKGSPYSMSPELRPKKPD